MADSPPLLTTQKLVRAGFRDLLKPPFRALLALNLFLTLASDSFGVEPDDVTAWLSLLLLAVSTYLQIALTLAAADLKPARSADTWVRAAFKQRCFWRFFVASLLSLLVIVLGFAALIVPGVILCGVLSLVQPAAVLERLDPIAAMRRSSLISSRARRPLAIFFFLLVLLPNVTLQAGFYLSGEETLGPEWVTLDLITVVLSMGATIALTRAFVALRPPAPAADPKPAPN
ncbi:MAG: hypothetical protein QOH26_972 [Actinomycetota bacterium]|nr:hypothetical protein [Actinomycetota bacterium]